MQIVQEMYIRVVEEEVWTGEDYKKELRYDGCESDMKGYPGWTMVDDQRHKVTFEIPDNFNMNHRVLESLKEEMEKVRAVFQLRITELQAQYNQHLSIEG
jgi:hypothetical protein